MVVLGPIVTLLRSRMTALIKLPRFGIGPGFVITCLLLTGCQTIHDVKVDAITNLHKPGGTSYRLEVKDAGGGVDKEAGALAVSSTKSALAARGLFEAPANTPPDMVINLEYGVGPGEIRIVYQSNTDMGVSMTGAQRSAARPLLVFEKYLELSARVANAPADPPARGGAGNPEHRGEELWNVRVSVEDPKRDLAPYLVILANASIDYIGRNSGSAIYLRMDSEGNLRGRMESAPGR